MPLPAIRPIGASTAAARPSQAWTAPLNNWLVAPGNTNPPVVFEPPPVLTAGDYEVWMAASGGPDWGGCQVWVSSDGASYGLVGTIYAGGVTGALSAAFPTGADPDTTNTLAVDLTESRGRLLSGSSADADNHITLCFVDGELVAYQTATLTAAYRYALGTYLRRGCYGTPIAAHGVGATFARLNSSVFKYIYPANLVGIELSVKMPAFNVYGQALQGLDGLTPTTYTLTGDGAVAAPAYVSGSIAGRPAAAAAVQRFVFATGVTLSAGLSGSAGSAGTSATAAAAFTLARNGSAVATMTFSAGAATAGFTAASTITFAAGDVLTVTAPSPADTTLADLAWTFAGTY